MKKYSVIMATVALLLVLAPAALAAPPTWGGWDNCGDTCYTVQSGDTLFSIGRMYGVNPYHIAWANRLPNPDCIYEGQVLIIPTDDCCQFGWYGRPGYGPSPTMWYGGPPPMYGFGSAMSGFGPDPRGAYIYGGEGGPFPGYGFGSATGGFDLDPRGPVSGGLPGVLDQQ